MYCGESLVSFLHKHDMTKTERQRFAHCSINYEKIPGSPHLCNFNVRVPEHGSLGTRKLQVQECNSWFHCALYLELSDCCKALSFEFYRRQSCQWWPFRSSCTLTLVSVYSLLYMDIVCGTCDHGFYCPYLHCNVHSVPLSLCCKVVVYWSCHLAPLD